MTKEQLVGLLAGLGIVYFGVVAGCYFAEPKEARSKKNFPYYLAWPIVLVERLLR